MSFGRPYPYPDKDYQYEETDEERSQREREAEEARLRQEQEAEQTRLQRSEEELGRRIEEFRQAYLSNGGEANRFEEYLPLFLALHVQQSANEESVEYLSDRIEKLETERQNTSERLAST